jgi:hypothetical protein
VAVAEGFEPSHGRINSAVPYQLGYATKSKDELGRRKDEKSQKDLHPSTFILPPSSFRFHSSAFILPPSSFRLHPSAFILPPSSFHLHPSAFILPPSSFRLHPSAFILPPSSLGLEAMKGVEPLSFGLQDRRSDVRLSYIAIQNWWTGRDSNPYKKFARLLCCRLHHQPKKSGGCGWSRTTNLALMRRLLCRLSYTALLISHV